MGVYRRTSCAVVCTRVPQRFGDRAGSDMTHRCFQGVLFADGPVDANEGTWGDVVRRVALSDTVVAEYEWIEDGRPYRESLVSAALVNTCGRPQFLAEEVWDDV